MTGPLPPVWKPFIDLPSCVVQLPRGPGATVTAKARLWVHKRRWRQKALPASHSTTCVAALNAFAAKSRPRPGTGTRRSPCGSTTHQTWRSVLETLTGILARVRRRHDVAREARRILFESAPRGTQRRSFLRCPAVPSAFPSVVVIRSEADIRRLLHICCQDTAGWTLRRPRRLRRHIKPACAARTAALARSGRALLVQFWWLLDAKCLLPLVPAHSLTVIAKTLARLSQAAGTVSWEKKVWTALSARVFHQLRDFEQSEQLAYILRSFQTANVTCDPRCKYNLIGYIASRAFSNGPRGGDEELSIQGITTNKGLRETHMSPTHSCNTPSVILLGGAAYADADGVQVQREAAKCSRATRRTQRGELAASSGWSVPWGETRTDDDPRVITAPPTAPVEVETRQHQLSVDLDCLAVLPSEWDESATRPTTLDHENSSLELTPETRLVGCTAGTGTPAHSRATRMLGGDAGRDSCGELMALQHFSADTCAAFLRFLGDSDARVEELLRDRIHAGLARGEKLSQQGWDDLITAAGCRPAGPMTATATVAAKLLTSDSLSAAVLKPWLHFGALSGS